MFLLIRGFGVLGFLIFEWRFNKSSQKVRCPNFKKLRLGAINFHFSKVGRKDKSGIINGGEMRKF